jgi:Na+/H+ antiporter NhaC
MGADSQVIEYRFLGSVASLIATLILWFRRGFHFQYRSIGSVVCSFIE